MTKDELMTTDDSNTSARTLPALLTIKQAGTHLMVSTKTIYRWIKSGDLVAHRFDRGYRISESDLQIFIRMRPKCFNDGRLARQM